MKTKFLYLLIIVFSVSLSSCRKQRMAEKGLVGTWDVTVSGGSGVFELDKRGDGNILILNNSTNEVIHNIQINKLNVFDHSNDSFLPLENWHTYQGDFYTENGNYAYFQIWEATENNEKDKISKESQKLEMDISFYDGDNNGDAPFDFDLDIIMTRQ